MLASLTRGHIILHTSWPMLVPTTLYVHFMDVMNK